MELYRYISFESFVDIVQSQELTFVDPSHSWDDGYEGIVFRAMQTEHGWSEIQKIVATLPGGHILVPQMAEPIRCQCWSKSRDSIALWSMYSYDNKAIMIKTSDEKIKNLSNGQNGVKLFEIDYYKTDIDNDLEAVIRTAICRAIIGNSIEISQFFRLKRDCFEHEKEVRAISTVPIGENFSSWRKKALRIKIITPIFDFIEEVMVHPKAANWFVHIVDKYCSNNDMNFSGRSKILQFTSKSHWQAP